MYHIMNTKIKTLTAILASFGAFALAKAQDRDHDHDDQEDHGHESHDHGEIEAPNGGRIVDSVEPHLEFYVDDSGKVKITFLDEEGDILAPAEQIVSLIGGDRSNPTRLSFSKSGNVLVSDKTLPEGNNLPIILNIKVNTRSKTVREKFNLNLSECPTCGHQEYACVCAHGEDDREDHDHKGHDH